jgi:hypothetical protein
MSRGPTARLALGLAVVAAIWGGVLPALLRCRGVARHVARMEERGVNPAAMYYTELERLPLRPAWLDRHVTLWP